MNVRITKLGEACGAEVTGVELKAPLSSEVVAVLDDAFLTHGVLVFREQPLSATELVRFSRHFGELQAHVQRAYQHPEEPEVVVMTNRKQDGTFDDVGARRGAVENPSDGWHSDLSYDDKPGKATLLHALEVPSRGGNTCFANVHAAYESLPAALRAEIVGLQAEFRLGTGMRSPLGAKAAENLDEAGRRSVAVHPIVNVHPETGRPGIYVNPLITSHVLGVSAQRGETLLKRLFEAIDDPRHHWEHRWTVGDTLMWDNRGGTMHCGRLDYPRTEARRFIRTTVRGGPTRALRA